MTLAPSGALTGLTSVGAPCAKHAWPKAARSTSVRTAAPSRRGGKVAATPAASGTASLKSSEAGAPAVSRRATRGRVFELEGLAGEGRPAPRIATGIRRIRPRHRRRLRAGLGAAARRRAGHRQIHSAHPGLRDFGAPRRARRLYFGRRGRRPGAPARDQAQSRRCAGGARRRNPGRGHSRHLRDRRPPGVDRDRFDTDDAHQHGGVGAWNGDAGARKRPGAPAPRQDDGLDDRSRRPCHEGRAGRRAARRRTHGRRRPVLRGRRRASFPHAARLQEPIWRDRRNRRLRDDQPRPRRSRQSIGAFSRRPRLSARRAPRSSPAWRGSVRC